ncbi:DUF3613 domain-containing protein [Pseudomonas sp. X10]
MPKYLLLLTLAGVPLLALAEEAQRVPRPETATEALLRMQSSNQQASKTPQAQTPKERDQSMQRWLDAYKHEIPEFYHWSKVNSSNN